MVETTNETSYLDKAKRSLDYHARKTPSATCYVTELVGGFCLDFLVSEGENFNNSIEWHGSRREGYVMREPLGKRELARLENKYRLVEKSFSDKQWNQGYSVTVYGDGMYGMGPGNLSLVVDEGWACEVGASWPTIRMPFATLKNNLEDASLPGQPYVFVGTPGSVCLERLISEPSKLHTAYPKYGLGVYICSGTGKEVASVSVLNPLWEEGLEKLHSRGCGECGAVKEF